MLIDRLLPLPQFAERHAAVVPGPPARVYEILREVDFARSSVVRLLFAARGLGPAFRQGQRRIHASLEDFLRAGFLLLDERPGDEIVVGTAWGPRAGSLDAARFPELDEPGHIKIAMNFTVRPHGDGSLVATETRVRGTDEAARRTFARYWLLVGPFSALIRRRMLAVLRAEAARTATSGTSGQR